MVKVAKKLFTLSVVTMTILWSVGIAALVPAVVLAEDCPALEAGDLFKVPGNSAVYLLNADMERMYFPNGEVYKTWYADYSGVQEIPNTCVDAYPAPSAAPYGVNYRAGSRMVKVEISPSVYVVEPGNVRSKIASEEAAIALYGVDWASMVRDVADVYWPNFASEGAELDGEMLVDGMLVYGEDGETVYSAMDGMLYAVDGDLGVAMEVQTVSADLLASLEMGTETVTPASLVEDASQLGSMPTDTGDDEEVVVPVVGGDVSVSLSANTPDAGNVVASSTVVFAKFILRAGDDEDATVNSVKIGRSGLGSTSDFQSVTLYEGAAKLGNTKTSWHSDGYMTYNISGGWTIPAGTTKELTIKAILDDAGTYNKLGILDLAVGTGGDVSGTPVYGNQMSAVSVNIGQVTVTGQGTNAGKNVGSTDVNLTKFKLVLSSVEDAEFSAITLKNKGTAADGDVANMYLYLGSTMLAGPVSMVADKVTFQLDEPVSIEKSKNETFTVKGDIMDGGASSNTVIFSLEYDTDITVVGDTYNANLTVVRTNYDTAASDDGRNTITIGGAELDIAFTSVALETGDEVTDVELGRFTVSSGATDAKFTNLILHVSETDGNSDSAVDDIDELELIDATSGASYSGVNTASADSNTTQEVWTFSDEIELLAGVSRTFIVRGDIPAAATAGDNANDAYSLSATVNTTNFTIETIPAGDAVSNFSIGSYTGKVVTVKTPTLTFKATTMNDGTAVVNDTDVVLFKGTIEGVGETVHIERLKFDAATSDTSTTTLATNMDVDNWTQIGLYTVDSAGEYTQQQLLTSSNLTDGELDFDTLDFDVEVGSANKVTFVVKGTVAATAPSNTTVQLQLQTISAKDLSNDDATVQDAAGTAIADNTDLLTTRTVVLYSTGILYIQMRDDDVGVNKDKVVLAGSSFWAGKLRLKAAYEPIKVKDLKLTNPNADTEGEISSVCLYSAQSAIEDNLLGCTTLDTNDVAFFDDIDHVVAVGTEDVWIYVTTNQMGDGGTQTSGLLNAASEAIQFYVASTTGHVVAEGAESFVALDPATLGSTPGAAEFAFDEDLNGVYGELADDVSAQTKDFYVAGTRISNVALVSATPGDGFSVASSIEGSGDYILAILELQTEASNNEVPSGATGAGEPIKMAIKELRFDMNKYVSTTFSTSAGNGVKAMRFGGSQGWKSLTTTASSTGYTAGDTADDWYISDATSTFGVDALIEPGDTAYFIVTGYVDNLAIAQNVTNWVQVGLDDVKGAAGAADANNNIDWFDGSDVTYAAANDLDFLLLDTESITGTKVSAAKNN
jgi:hypothetical protein